MTAVKRFFSDKPLFFFILAALFLVYEMTLQVYPGVVAEFLSKDLQLTAYSLGLMSGSYFYTYTIMQIPAGLLLDRLPIHKTITIPILLCVIGSYFFSEAHSITFGIIGRMCTGAGSAFAFIGTLVVASDLFPKNRFALFVGITQLLAALGAIAGGSPLIPLVNHYGWRETLFMLSVAGFFLALLVWFFLNYKKPKDTVSPVKQTSTLRSLKEICRSSQTWIIALYVCVLWAPMSAFASLWGIPYLEHTHHLTHVVAANVCVMMWIGIAVGSPLVGWWSDRSQNRCLPLFLTAILGTLAFVLVIVCAPLSKYALGTLLFLAGAACSGQALSFAVVRENNSLNCRATAIGFNNMAVVIAGAFFQPLVGKLIDLSALFTHPNNLLAYTAFDYQVGISLVAICFGIGSFVSFYFIREPGVPHYASAKYLFPQFEK
jgi:MFS family permease